MEVTDGKIRVEPIVNVTKLVAIGALLAAWTIFWGTRTARVIAKTRAAERARST